MTKIVSHHPPKLMGIVNITPDSFSDGGKYYDARYAIDHAVSMVQSGADIVDFGAESTRPGSLYLDAKTEIERLKPVLDGFRYEYPKIQISLDTRKSQVVEEFLKQNIAFINDISALRNDRLLTDILISHPEIKIILMHMKGDPSTMQAAPEYVNLIDELLSFFDERIEYSLRSGIREDQICIDPGIGFGKSLEHNISILSSLSRIKSLGYPVVLGASRKRFINEICPANPDQRLAGTLATSLSAMIQGVDIIRVHDVFEHKQFFQVFDAITEDIEWTF